MDDIEILLIEDNLGDINLIEHAFEDRDLPGNVHSVQTGEEALNRLRGEDESAEATYPELILLDLNLPATSGQNLLTEINSDPSLKRIPVVILTGSEAEADITMAYEAGANACLLKPVDPNEFADKIQIVVEFWQCIVTPPSVSGCGEDR